MSLESLFAKVLRRASVLLSNTRCAFVLEGVRCEKASSCECAICHAPFCIEHAMHAFQTADAVCLHCVNEYAAFVEARGVLPGRAARAPVNPFAADGVGRKRAEPPSAEDGIAARRRACLKVLGLDDDATEDEIKAAFKNLAKKYHPDRASGEAAKKKAHSKFVQVSAAYEWLIKNGGRQAA